MTDDRLELIAARTDDLLTRRGVTDACFYNLRESYFLRSYLHRLGRDRDALFYGGYPDAERVMLFVVPEYLSDFCDALAPEEREKALSDAMAEEISGAICPLLIRGSTYRVLRHRDYMGAILALGIERDCVGDILPQDDYSAVLFAERRMARYLCDQLTGVGADTVTTAPYTLPEGFTSGRTFRRVTDTVASPRLDCVVASLCNLSREQAKNRIAEGLCERNYAPAEKPDADVEEGDILSVRGHGKWRILAVSQPTKKGRLRLEADQYI